jgi:predicted  nucleic acid-binding Zn-ribbon protein
MASFPNTEIKTKTFWQKPEGTTGMLFLAGIIGGIGFLLFKFSAAILAMLSNTLGIVALLGVLGLIIYMILDPKWRTLVSYMYKSVMRWITGIFVTIDPIGILKNYISDLQDNLTKMGTQIGGLKGQMRKLITIVEENNKEISNNMLIAKKAKEQNNESAMLLASRKAARLTESNEKYTALHNKMSILYRVLTKMYSNSEILIEDTVDQVKVKEQERKAIRASHSAMRSAMSIIKGDADKRAMFDQAMEVIADDVANKVGEMERFMEMSAGFMNSIDLQNGVFEEQGLKMLEDYEKNSTLMLLGGKEKADDDILDLKQPQIQERGSEYDGLFNNP